MDNTNKNSLFSTPNLSKMDADQSKNLTQPRNVLTLLDPVDYSKTLDHSAVERVARRPMTQQVRLSQQCQDLVSKRAQSKEQQQLKKVKAIVTKKELAQYYFRKYEIKARASDIQNLSEK